MLITCHCLRGAGVLMACVALCLPPGVVAGDAAATLPATRIVRLPAAPVIDGRVDDAAWREAAPVKLEHTLYQTNAPAVDTLARLGHDDRFLYIGVHCLEDGVRQPSALPGIVIPDTIGMQDHLELFLMPDGRQRKYYHFVLAAGGACREQRVADGQRDEDWNLAYTAAAAVVSNGWEAEWAIPLYVLGDGRLADDFRLNICRARQTEPLELITWSPLGEKAARRGFHDPDNFVRVVDAGTIAVGRIFAPRIVGAVIRAPYRACSDGGFEYDLALALENQGGLTGSVKLVVVHQSPGSAQQAWSHGPMFVPAGSTNYAVNVSLREKTVCQPVAHLEVDGQPGDDFQPRGASLLTPGVRAAAGAELAGYGANAQALGEPIGGGPDYSRMVDTADVEVAAAAELAAVLKDWNARPAAEVAGKIIRVAAGADWDMAEVIDPGTVKPYQSLFSVPPGVTLAGDRGRSGAPGPILRFSVAAGAPADVLAQKTLISLGAGARLTGLRLRGPDIGHQDPASVTAANSRFRGVSAGPGAEVDNCQVSHFAWADVDVSAPDARVRCNDLSDSAYPVLVGGSNGCARIEGNLIRWAWHAIAGSGEQGTGYEAAHNRFVHIGPGWPAHAVDMHAMRRLMRGHGGAYPYLSIAGDAMQVHHNTFEDDAAAIRSYRALRGMVSPAEPSCGVCVRGVPRLVAEIFNNRFAAGDPGRACRIIDNIGAPPGCLDRANFRVFDNVFSGDNMLVPLSLETLPLIRFVKPGLAVPRIGRKFSTRHAHVLRPDEKMPVELEIEIMPPLRIKKAAVYAGSLDMESRHLFSGARAPNPGEIVIDAAAWGAGCYVLTAEVEDERGVVGRHSTAFTVAGGEE